MADEGKPASVDGREAGAGARLVAVVLAAAVAVVAAVGVQGEFPLSDDWGYAETARALCTDGTLRIGPWTGASLVLQAGYGAALCKVGGFSFTLLRLSTLVLATSGVVAFALWLRTLGVRGSALVLATGLLALNPLYLSLAFTFMTDVPCTVAAVWAAYAYSRGLEEDRTRLLVLGSLAAAAALLIRQHGIFVAAAASGAALLAADRPWAARVRAAAVAGAIPALAFVGCHLWFLSGPNPPAGLITKIAEANRMTATGVLNSGFRGAMYLGLFVAPLLVGFRHPLHAYHPRLLRTAYLVTAILAIALFVRERAAMFYLTNVLYDLGVGALSLRDTQVLALRPIVQIGFPLSLVLTALAGLATSRAAATWLGTLPRWREPAPAFATLATALLFAGTLLHARYYFDRYLLLVLPFAIASLMVLRPLPVLRPLSLLLAVAWGGYALAGTHDYLAWNRARHAGIAALESAGVPPTAIDGGFEYNAALFAPTLGTSPGDAETRPGQPYTRRSWWWVIDETYVLSFRPLPGYRVRERRPFPRWLPPGTGHIFVLERRPTN
jgi:hypothetical protein